LVDVAAKAIDLIRVLEISWGKKKELQLSWERMQVESCSAKVASYVRIKTRSHPKRSEAKGVPSTGWAPDFGLEPWKSCERGGRIQISSIRNLCAFRPAHIFTVEVPSCNHCTTPKD